MLPFIEGLGSTREKTTVQMDDDVIVIQRRAEDLLRKANTGVKELHQKPACKNLHFLKSGKISS